MSDLLQTAKQESDRLREELARNVTFQKLQQVEKLIDLYEKAETREPMYADATATSGRQTSARQPRPRSHREPQKRTKKAAILEVVSNHLRQNGRATSGELFRVLKDHGIDVPGKRPSTAVAAIVGQSGLYDNVPGEGYGLLDQKDKAPSDGAESASRNTGESGASPAVASEGVAPQ